MKRREDVYKRQGKNPLQIDSAKPNEDYQSFLRGEVRYASLRMKNPEHADALFAESEKNALGRYESLIQKMCIRDSPC